MAVAPRPEQGARARDALAGRYRLPSERPRFGRGSEGDRLGCEQADRFVAQQAAAVATRPAPQHELSESREVGRGGKQPCVARYPTQLERTAVVDRTRDGMPAPHPGGRDARAQTGRGPEHRLVKVQGGEDLPRNEDVEWLAPHAPDDLAE